MNVSLTIEVQDAILKHASGGLTLPEIVVMYTSLMETGDLWKLPTDWLDECGALLQHNMIGKGRTIN